MSSCGLLLSWVSKLKIRLSERVGLVQSRIHPHPHYHLLICSRPEYAWNICIKQNSINQSICALYSIFIWLNNACVRKTTNNYSCVKHRAFWFVCCFIFWYLNGDLIICKLFILKICNLLTLPHNRICCLINIYQRIPLKPVLEPSWINSEFWRPHCDCEMKNSNQRCSFC